ncbi:G-protein coupled receptor Mth-like [Musca vetustissima]|nr:G-protein coupled receptor Mth-like [Musca vetustissima]
MGVSWLLDIVSYIETLLYPDDINPLYYVSDFMNAILGLLIFVCFVLKPKVLSLIKKRLFGKQDETDNTTHSDCEEEEISLNGIGSDVSKERKELN